MIQNDGVGGEEMARQFQQHVEARGTVRGDHRGQLRGKLHGGVVRDYSEDGGGVQKMTNEIKPGQEHGALESDVKIVLLGFFNCNALTLPS